MKESSSMFTIVLVQPEDNANIGAVARAMKNMGFSSLTLVDPPRFDIERAGITACRALDVLENCRIALSLEDALKDMEDVIGFSARRGKNRPVRLINEWLEEARATAGKTALVFGPEETGLHEAHSKHCRWLVRIPTNPECSSLNLAQSVLIVLYELSKLEPSFQKERPEIEPVPWSEYEHLDNLIHAVLEQSEFYNEGTPPHLPDVVSNLFRRILPNNREMKILQGIFGRLKKTR